ncbi:MAG: cupredoxin domain-containing protein [Balneolaceae bacterium]|nr:cupredoxin domain-containing protein [Balneolaceae bacterium]
MANIFFKNQTAIIGAGFVIVLIVMMLLLLTTIENKRENKPYVKPRLINVTIKNFAFSPDTLTIPVDTLVTIKFINQDSVIHEFKAGITVNSQRNGFETDLFEGVKLDRGAELFPFIGEGYVALRDTMKFKIPPKRRATLKFTLPESKEGTYRMGCFERKEGKTHYEMGMNGVIIVESQDQ